MSFIALKHSSIQPIKNGAQVTLLKSNNNHTGFYKEFSVKKGQLYKIGLQGSNGRMKGRLRFRIESMDGTQLFYAEYFNFVKTPIFKRLYQHDGQTGKVKIGIWFVNCTKGDNYYVKILKLVPIPDIDLTENLRNIVKTSPLLEWTENESKKNIELTVALPTQKAKKIIWLALEGLRRQQLDFGWELVIWDDGADSLSVVKQFIGKLPLCQRVVYRAVHSKKNGRKIGNLKGTFPLIDKWIGMALDSAQTSKVYVLHAADCFSGPKRLWVHYEHLKNDTCYFSTQTRGLFYNLLTNQKMFYIAPKTIVKPRVTGTHLNMAMRTDDMRIMMPIDRNKSIDGHILQTILRNHVIDGDKYILPFSSVASGEWAYSIDTDGANRISLSRRKAYSKPVTYFHTYATGKKKLAYKGIKFYIPANVVNFLVKYR